MSAWDETQEGEKGIIPSRHKIARQQAECRKSPLKFELHGLLNATFTFTRQTYENGASAHLVCRFR